MRRFWILLILCSASVVKGDEIKMLVYLGDIPSDIPFERYVEFTQNAPEDAFGLCAASIPSDIVIADSNSYTLDEIDLLQGCAKWDIWLSSGTLYVMCEMFSPFKPDSNIPLLPPGESNLKVAKLSVGNATFDICLDTPWFLRVRTVHTDTFIILSEDLIASEDWMLVEYANAEQREGYEFIEWTASPKAFLDCIADPLSPRPGLSSMTPWLAGNGTLIAVYAPSPSTLTVSSTVGGSVMVPGEGSFSCETLADTSVDANSEDGYHFLNWTGTAVTAGKVANPNLAGTTVTMHGDYTLIANFEKKPAIQVATQPVLASDITSTSAILRGQITDDAGDSDCWCKFSYFKTSEGFTQAVNTDEQAITTVNGQGEFSQLLEGLEPNCAYGYQAKAGNSTDDDIGQYEYFTTPDVNVSQVALTVLESVGGEVLVPGPGIHTFARNASAPITAQADPNYIFMHWTGTAVDANQVVDAYAAVTTVLMEDSYTLQAVFEPNNIIDLDSVYWYVDATAIENPVQDGTADHPFASIQEAIDAAKDDYTVVVLPGLYVESLNFMGKPICVTSLATADPNALASLETPNYLGAIDRTIIHGNYEGPVVVFENHEDANSMLRGFTITGGLDRSGGAILCSDSGPTISHCVIAGNRATRYGGVVDSYQSAMTFIQCTIVDNYSHDNSGAAISCADSNDLFINCIVWGNHPDQIVAMSGNDPVILYSDVQGSIWPGTGNVSEDPLFALPGMWVDAEDANIPVDASVSDAHWVLGDTHVQSTAGRYDPNNDAWVVDANMSPCIDLGDPNSPLGLESEPNGGRVNAGAYGGTLDASRSEPNSTVLYQWLLDTDPGWSVQGSWQYGLPLGGGGINGNPDPAAGHTGAFAYGVNLSGDYEGAIGGPYALTVGPLDCTSYEEITLSFWRWLNSDATEFVRNTVETSLDGVNWTVLWETTGPEPVADDQWTPKTFDLSPHADDQSTVYLRWTYEIQGRAYLYSGWNIDDIEIRGTPIE